MEDVRGVEAWKEETSASDRVRSVSGSLSQPRSVSWIADQAAVPKTTARRHLDRLAETGILGRREYCGTTTYAPNQLHDKTRTIRELRKESDNEGLVQLKEELQKQIDSWRDEHSVNSPGELRKLDTGVESQDIRRTANSWELIRYRLEIVEIAIEGEEDRQ